jgi:hypothetical protein
MHLTGLLKKAGDYYVALCLELNVEPVPDLLTALKLPKYAKTTVKEFEQERKELAEDVVER